MSTWRVVVSAFLVGPLAYPPLTLAFVASFGTTDAAAQGILRPAARPAYRRPVGRDAFPPRSQLTYGEILGDRPVAPLVCRVCRPEDSHLGNTLRPKNDAHLTLPKTFSAGRFLDPWLEDRNRITTPHPSAEVADVFDPVWPSGRALLGPDAFTGGPMRGVSANEAQRGPIGEGAELSLTELQRLEEEWATNAEPDKDPDTDVPSSQAGDEEDGSDDIRSVCAELRRRDMAAVPDPDGTNCTVSPGIARSSETEKLEK